MTTFGRDQVTFTIRCGIETVNLFLNGVVNSIERKTIASEFASKDAASLLNCGAHGHWHLRSISESETNKANTICGTGSKQSPITG
jgi:hypothetical protein